MKYLALALCLFAGTASAYEKPYRPKSTEPRQITIVDGRSVRIAWTARNSDGSRTIVLGPRIDELVVHKLKRPNYPAQGKPVVERQRDPAPTTTTTRRPNRGGGYLPEGPQMIENPYYRGK